MVALLANVAPAGVELNILGRAILESARVARSAAALAVPRKVDDLAGRAEVADERAGYQVAVRLVDVEQHV